MTAELLDAAKNYLDITWTDEDTDIKLTGILARSRSYLDRVAGVPLNYSLEGDARALLFDYVRYVRSNALDEFLNNYLSEILALQMHAEVADDTESP